MCRSELLKMIFRRRFDDSRASLSTVAGRAP